jgi:hypothetical protein
LLLENVRSDQVTINGDGNVQQCRLNIFPTAILGYDQQIYIASGRCDPGGKRPEQVDGLDIRVM